MVSNKSSKGQSPQINIQSDSLNVEHFIEMLNNKNIRVYYNPSWFGPHSWKKVNLQDLSEDEAITEFFRLFGIYTFKHNNAWYLSKESNIRSRFATGIINQLSPEKRNQNVH